jgi:hypothetical protein
MGCFSAAAFTRDGNFHVKVTRAELQKIQHRGDGWWEAFMVELTK